MRRETEARANAIGMQILPFEASAPERLADVLDPQRRSSALTP